MSYALVEDVPASWEWYEVFARALGQRPSGLLLHVAGPTDEGFRIIEVWESEESWRSYARHFETALASVDPAVGATATRRAVQAVHVVRGDAWPDSAAPVGSTPAPSGGKHPSGEETP